jgi:hypothetical protein
MNSTKIAALLCLLTLAGCKSAADKANDAALAQARQTAASTNAPQQVVWNDKDGNTVTTIVQPPAPGQTVEQVQTSTTKHTTSGGQTTNTTTTSTSMQPVPNYAGSSAPTPAATTAEVPGQPAPLAAAPAPGPTAPVITPVELNVPRGTVLSIRIDQHISVKHSHAGDRFSGEVVHDVIGSNDTRIAIPRNTRVNGVIDEAHRRGHFKGRSILELRLTSMELNGQRYDLDTRDNVRTKKGKGKRTGAFIGGGAGLGMLIGGVATGGVGLVEGGLAGGGAGTLLGGFTGNRDIEIPAESVMNFRLADDLAVQPQN